MKKRLLAMLMVLMLVVSLLPVGALADGTSKPSSQGFFNDNGTVNPAPSELDPDDLNGTAFQIVVFVDGTKVDDPYTYINAPERVGSDLGWSATLSNDGNITCDFEYETCDCADVKITLKDADKYYVQGIMYGQSYGESGANNVEDRGNGVYVIDNMCDAIADNAVIYIDTKYNVEYYLNNAAYPTDNDDKVYVLNRIIQTTDDGVKDPTVVRKDVKWRNPECEDYVSVKFNLPAVPENAEGWYAYNTGDALSREIRLKSV